MLEFPYFLSSIKAAAAGKHESGKVVGPTMGFYEVVVAPHKKEVGLKGRIKKQEHLRFSYTDWALSKVRLFLPLGHDVCGYISLHKKAIHSAKYIKNCPFSTCLLSFARPIKINLDNRPS